MYENSFISPEMSESKINENMAYFEQLYSNTITSYQHFMNNRAHLIKCVKDICIHYKIPNKDFIHNIDKINRLFKDLTFEEIIKALILQKNNLNGAIEYITNEQNERNMLKLNDDIENSWLSYF